MTALYEVFTAVYPLADSDMVTPSYIKTTNVKLLNKAMMDWLVKNYLHNMAEDKNPRINLVAANLKGLPPATIITDETDPLQSEGPQLADKLKAAAFRPTAKIMTG